MWIISDIFIILLRINIAIGVLIYNNNNLDNFICFTIFIYR